jgi:hypothetical protein
LKFEIPMTDTIVKPRPAAAISPLHSGICVPTFVTLEITATLFPLAAGVAIFGWRALGTVGVVVTSAMGAMSVLRLVGWRGRQVRMWHCLWLFSPRDTC